MVMLSDDLPEKIVFSCTGRFPREAIQITGRFAWAAKQRDQIQPVSKVGREIP